jgi:YebC/PmpR family DNA-binding regulatory protein
MSGHSHWAGIRHKKALVDSKKGRVFSKLARSITMAAREGGGDPATNIKLEFAIDEGRKASMPKDTIDRAIKKGTGEAGGAIIETLNYEGYAPGGVALMIEIVTDNRNRTASEIRHLMERHGANLAGSGAVAWMFEKKGLIMVDADKANEDELMTIALDAGAEDMQKIGDAFQITCTPADFLNVRKALEAKNIPMTSATVTQVPNNNVPVDANTGRKILNLLEALDEHDDVQNVYANFELPQALLEEMS